MENHLFSIMIHKEGAWNIQKHWMLALNTHSSKRWNTKEEMLQVHALDLPCRCINDGDQWLLPEHSMVITHVGKSMKHTECHFPRQFSPQSISRIFTLSRCAKGCDFFWFNFVWRYKKKSTCPQGVLCCNFPWCSIITFTEGYTQHLLGTLGPWLHVGLIK